MLYTQSTISNGSDYGTFFDSSSFQISWNFPLYFTPGWNHKPRNQNFYFLIIQSSNMLIILLEYSPSYCRPSHSWCCYCYRSFFLFHFLICPSTFLWNFLCIWWYYMLCIKLFLKRFRVLFLYINVSLHQKRKIPLSPFFLVSSPKQNW